MNIKSIAISLRIHQVNFAVRLYHWYLFRRLPNHDIVVPCNGLQMYVHNSHISIMGRSIFLTGVWEPEATQFISSVLKPGMSVVDIGAEIGYYTLLFARLVGPKGCVYSFEPKPSIKAKLDKNIERNGLDNVRTFGLALFDESGVACLEETTARINPHAETLSESDEKVEMMNRVR